MGFSLDPDFEFEDEVEPKPKKKRGGPVIHRKPTTKDKENSEIHRRVHEQNCLAQHKSSSWEHYTPESWVKLVRELMGGITLDPASSWLANTTVKADYWHGLQKDGTLTDGLAVPWTGKVFLNPPGGNTVLVRNELSGVSRSYPVLWWMKLISEYMKGNIEQAVYIAFSLEQLVFTQREDTLPIAGYPLCIPKKRGQFYYPDNTIDGKPTPLSNQVIGSQPTHGNAIVYLPPKDDPLAVEKFFDLFSTVGCVRV
jgi:hypothetical protein